MSTDYTRANKQGIIPKSRKRWYVLHVFEIDVYQNGTIVDHIRRTLNAQDKHNWISGSRTAKGHLPLVIRYKKKLYIVQSKAGDLSDPAERNDSFLKSLFIELPDPNTCHFCKGHFETSELKGSQYLICPECNKKDKNV